MPLELPTPTAPPTTGRCIVITTRADLPPEDQASLDGWLADTKNVAAWQIAHALNLGTTTIKDHRGRRCVCYRGEKS